MRAAHSPSFGPGASLFSRQDVLRAVSTIAGDSKDFVDSPLKFSHSVVSAAFDALPLPHADAAGMSAVVRAIATAG